MAPLPVTIAAMLVLVAGATLVTQLVRLALAARHADDRGATAVPWPLPLAAGVLIGLAQVLRMARYLLDTAPSVPELVLTGGLEAGAAFLLASFFDRTARGRLGGELDGARTAGLILFATSLASLILAAGKSTFTLQVQTFVALGFGAIAWSLASLAAFAEAARVEPPWVATFARVASQLLVLDVWIRALLAGPGAATATRLALAIGLLLAALFAAPAMAGVRGALAAVGEGEVEAGAEARGSGEAARGSEVDAAR